VVDPRADRQAIHMLAREEQQRQMRIEEER
jgi:hypothetical protein